MRPPFLKGIPVQEAIPKRGIQLLKKVVPQMLHWREVCIPYLDRVLRHRVPPFLEPIEEKESTLFNRADPQQRGSQVLFPYRVCPCTALEAEAIAEPLTRRAKAIDRINVLQGASETFPEMDRSGSAVCDHGNYC